MKNARKLFFLFFVALFLNSGIAQKRVLCVGNSITYGSKTGGYRGYLWDWKYAIGNFVFVGPYTSPGQPHFGTPGATTDFIKQWIKLAIQYYNPDIILLMAGTNDIALGKNSDYVLKNLYDIVDLIYKTSTKKPIVFIHEITPIASPPHQKIVDKINAQMPWRVALPFLMKGLYCVPVMNDPAVTVKDLIDGIHPNELGYMKLAASWYYWLYLACHHN